MKKTLSKAEKERRDRLNDAALVNKADDMDVSDENYESNEDMDEDITEELKEFARQTYESSKEVASDVATHVQRKVSDASDSMGSSIKKRSRKFSNSFLNGVEHALNSMQGGTSVAIRKAKNRIRRAKKHLNENEDFEE